MNNDLKKEVSFAVGVVCVAIGFYFIHYLPKQHRIEQDQRQQQELLSNQEKCYKMASDKYSKDVGPNSEPGAFNPEYRFVPETNQCLYKGGYISSQVISYFIVDVYTNKSVEYYTSSNGTEIYQLGGSKFEYDTVNDKYFKGSLLRR